MTTTRSSPSARPTCCSTRTSPLNRSWDRIVCLSKYQSVQLRAFDFFMANYEYDRARAVLETPLRPSDS